MSGGTPANDAANSALAVNAPASQPERLLREPDSVGGKTTPDQACTFKNKKGLPTMDMAMVSHTVSPTSPRLREPTQIEFVVTNNGPDPAPGVVLAALGDLEFRSALSSTGSCTFPYNYEIRCDLGTLLPGTNATVTADVLFVKTRSGGETENAVQVSGRGIDRDLDNNTSHFMLWPSPF